MEKLINTMPAILAAAGSAEEVSEAACLAGWKHAVGDALSSHAVPVKLVDAALTVAVADRVWQKQLQHMQAHLVYRLNLVLGHELVKSIEFRVEPERFQSVSEAHTGAEAREAPRPIPIELLSAASNIQDAELRKAFLGAALSCVQRTEQV